MTATTRFPSARRIVVIGRVDPIVRAGLVATLGREFDIIETAGNVDVVRQLGNHRDVAAIILPRSEVADADPSRSLVPWIGLSSASRDVLVVDRDRVTHLSAGNAEVISDFIRAAVHE